MEDKLLRSAAEIAGEFDVSPRTVTAWVREGAPIWRAGNKRQCRRQELIFWLEEKRKAETRLVQLAEKGDD